MSEEKEIKVKVGTKSRTIHVDYLARVEGEGSLYIRTNQNKVEELTLKIFEPPRFFEALLRGRSHTDAPDITSRICGICPVAYQMSAVCALEEGLGINIPEYIHQLRRLLYCGEWIESHTLHIFMLHAPDFLHYADMVQMSKEHPDIVNMGLRIKKAGNEIIKNLGGRQIHPINVKVGGFYKIPSEKELTSLIPILTEALRMCKQSMYWINTLTFPNFDRSYEYVSIYNDNEYPISRGRIVSSSGLNITAGEFLSHFEEQQVHYSTALHCMMKGKGAYLVGPMARYNLCRDKLSTSTLQLLDEIQFEKACTNPFRSIIIRMAEVYYAIEEAIRIISTFKDYSMSPSIEYKIKEMTCHAVTEAPRGLLFHKYQINSDGNITNANIIPPTSQNQRTIENDLYKIASDDKSLSDDQLRYKCEVAIRNYDPCISCSAHFLNLERKKM
ncbi:MAG: Ni/Fe hydrogenase subunit alpha [Chlamydiae bacterium]|nr:Ni/Fe hydrogenase subunit alpha [Chlamydiota bacterium]